MTAEAPAVLLWIRRPPFSTVHLSESIRVAAMTTALGVPLRLLFIGEGVRALARGPEPYRYGPPIEKTLAGIVTAERPALVHGPSLDRRGLDRDSLVAGLALERVDDASAADLVLRATQGVPF